MIILHDEHIKEYKILEELADYYCDQPDGSESPWQKYKRENYILIDSNELPKFEDLDKNKNYRIRINKV